MARYVAFLGSINVGGNRLLMADLRDALEREDFEDVETVVASGNVLFSHEERPSDGLSDKLAYDSTLLSLKTSFPGNSHTMGSNLIASL